MKGQNSDSGPIHLHRRRKRGEREGARGRMDARNGRGRNVAYSSEWETTPPPFHNLKPSPGSESRGRKEREREREERESGKQTQTKRTCREIGAWSFRRSMQALICLAREGCRCFAAAVSTPRPRISPLGPNKMFAQSVCVCTLTPTWHALLCCTGRVHFTPELETGPTPRGGARGGGGERLAPTQEKGSKAKARRGGLKQTTAPKLQIANHASTVNGEFFIADCPALQHQLTAPCFWCCFPHHPGPARAHQKTIFLGQQSQSPNWAPLLLLVVVVACARIDVHCIAAKEMRDGDLPFGNRVWCGADAAFSPSPPPPAYPPSDFVELAQETPRSRRGSTEWWGDSVISFLQAAVSPLIDGSSSNTSEDQWWAPSAAPAPPNASSLPKPLAKKKGPPPPISRRALVVGMGSRRGSATNMSWMIPCSASPTCASSSLLCASPSPKCAAGGGSGAGRERISKFLRG